MARQERRTLADMRAMEEENARVSMRGAGAGSAYGGRMTGAGATPSMGLSQRRGGRRAMEADAPPPRRRRKARSPSPPMEDDDDELEGGFFGALAAAARQAATRAAAAARAAAQRQAAAAAAARAASARAAQQAAAVRQPLLTATQKAAAAKVPSLPRSTIAQIASSAGKTGTALVKSGPTLAKQVAIGAVGKVAQVGTKVAKSGVIGKVGTVANIAIPAYMLADYLKSQQEAQNAGYYDDYAGTGTEGTYDDGGVPDGGMGDTFDTQLPPDEEGGYPDSEVAPDVGLTEREKKAEKMGITPEQLDYYLMTGNLPRGVTKKKGAGRKAAPKKASAPASGRRAERAAIVKRIMKERGVKLGEASRIVKEEGLF